MRRVLSRGLQVEAGSKTKSSRAQASQADMEAKDDSAVVIDAATDDAETLITTASFETVETDVSLSENTEVLSLDIGQRVAALTAGRTGMDFAEFVAAVRSSDGFYSTRQLQLSSSSAMLMNLERLTAARRSSSSLGFVITLSSSGNQIKSSSSSGRRKDSHETRRS